MGKTTLLKCLMGLVPVARGAIGFDGADVTRLAPHQRAARGIAYVPQGREIFPRLTVEENLLMGLATKPAARARRIKEEVYELFPVLQEHAGAPRRRPLRRPAAAAGDRPRAGRPSRSC